MSSRADRARRGAAVLTATVVVLGTGCIQRYAAPAEPSEVSPYLSIVSWKALELPPARGESKPLPESALRLVIGPSATEVYVDAVLIDGPGRASPGESWHDVEALFAARSEPIVVLLDARVSEPPCARLAAWASRVVVAVRPEGEDEPAAEPLTRWCPD